MGVVSAGAIRGAVMVQAGVGWLGRKGIVEPIHWDSCAGLSGWTGAGLGEWSGLVPLLLSSGDFRVVPRVVRREPRPRALRAGLEEWSGTCET